MTKEIRSPNVENSQLSGRRFRHSNFVIPSDFVICHSDLRIAVCSIKEPVSGLVRAAGGASVHGVEEYTLRPLSLLLSRLRRVERVKVRAPQNWPGRRIDS